MNKLGQEDIQCIKDDLVRFTEKEFFSKYYLRSANWYFKEKMQLDIDEQHDMLGKLKLIIVDCIPVSFNNIQIVGSSILGCSLSPKKAFREFQDTSDIDIALISPELFSELWREIRHSYSTKLKSVYGYLIKSIYRGYLNEKDLLKIPSVRMLWREGSVLSKKKIREEIGIPNEITYRLYRSWEDFEDYQIDSIQKLGRSLQCPYSLIATPKR